MKDSTKIFLLFGGLWLWNAGKRLYNQFNDLRFGIAGFKFITFSTEEKYIAVNVDFKIYNPYNLRLMFYSINSELLFNGKFVGKITSNINRYIYEKSETVIPITLKLHYQYLGEEIWQHITSGGRVDDWMLQIVGNTNIQNITIPLNLSFVLQDFVSGIGAINNDEAAEIFNKLYQNRDFVKLYEKAAKDKDYVTAFNAFPYIYKKSNLPLENGQIPKNIKRNADDIVKYFWVYYNNLEIL